MVADHSIGFRSVDREHEDIPIEVDGRVPEWLDGSLIRNGPGRFDAGGSPLEHWFDGLAMLTRFRFDGGSVRYSNRFLRSGEYRAVTGGGRIAASQFGTTSGGLLGRLRDAVAPTPTDNANVNVVRIGDRFVAITETQIGIEFDPSTLETIGQYRFPDLRGQMMTAHPHVDPVRRETVTFTTDFGRTSRYRLYRCSNGSERFDTIASLPTRRPSYVHSFGLTARYVVLVEFPFDVRPWELLIPSGESFIERYRWRPEEGTRFVVVDREDGGIVTERTGEAFFAFHHVNAFEDGDGIVVDVAAFDDPGVIDSLYLEELVTGGIPEIEGDLRRYRLPLDSGAIERETIVPTGVTLPRISPERNTRPYRFVYAQGTPVPGEDLPQRLLKIDVEARSTHRWADHRTLCGEPVFVPRPGATREDDGVVLSVVLEAAADRSSLLVLDGQTFDAVGRATLPHVVPFDFHGRFFGET